MKKITYKEIAEYINKSEQSIKGYKANNPELLDVLTRGSFCKKHNLNIEEIDKLLDMKKLLSDSSNKR